MEHPDAVVVGAGPNGLSAAVALAEAGASVLVLEAEDTIGGGARSAELTLPGLTHDICSAIHPFGASSPFFAGLPLEEHGLQWEHAEIPLAHPLDDGTASVLHRDLDRTVAELGPDGDRWRAWLGPASERFTDLAEDLLGPLLKIPRHPLLTAGVGLRALLPATVLATRLRTVGARALFGGIAAHSFLPLESPFTTSFALLLAAAGHHAGWPVARGGSQAITDALAGHLRSLGGEIRTGQRVTDLGELPPCRLTLLDVTPKQLLRIAGDRLPPRHRHRYQRWRYGPGAFKLDLAVEGGIPWTADACRRAGTVHVGGTLEEVASSERAVGEGAVSEQPYVLVAQQYLADPSRSKGDVHPIWAYCHVPNGYPGDATEQIESQIERFAPGFRERIVARHAWGPAELEAHDENYVGGDISGGSHAGLQLLARPRLSPDPYRTGIPGVFLCSSSTPPGGGVHGMSGYHAARSALGSLGG